MSGRFVAQVPATPANEVLFGTRRDFKSRLEIIADHLAKPLITGESYPSMTFAIYGHWGSGKSTTLGIIEDLVRRRAAAPTVGHNASASSEAPAGTDPTLTNGGGETTTRNLFTSSHYVAPLWEDVPEPRMSLTQVIVGDLLPGSLAEVVRVLRGVLGEPQTSVTLHDEREMKEAVELHFALRQLSPAPPLLEKWISETTYKLASHPQAEVHKHQPKVHPGADAPAEPVEESGIEDRQSHLHVVFIDDLDRCSRDFTAKLLAAITFWSRVENLFFVIAVSEEHLLNSLKENMPLGARGAKEALEKYIHISVEVPPLLMSSDEVASYLENLIDEIRPDNKDEQARLDELKETIKRSAEQYRGDNGCVLAPILRPAPQVAARLTPRAVKDRLNRVLAEFRPQASVSEEDLKRWIIVAFWPSFWWDYLHDVEGRIPESRDREWERRVMQIDDMVTLGRALRPLWGLSSDQLSSALSHMASERGVNIDSDIDPDLVIYLAMSPEWKRPPDGGGGAVTAVDSGVGSRLPSEPKILRVPAAQEPLESETSTSVGAADSALLYYVLAQQALEKEDGDEVLRNLRALSNTIDDPRVEASAATLGNGALLAEGLDDNLARELHEAALRADPHHANVIQNFVEFILKGELEDQYERAEEMLGPLLKEIDRLERPERVRSLSLRVRLARGKPVKELEPEIEALARSLTEKPTLQRLLAVSSLLREAGATDATRQVGRAVTEAAEDDNTRYRALRVIADALANSSLRRDEQEAADILLFLLRKGLPAIRSAEDVAAVKHNLATLLATMGFPRTAARLWLEVYRQDPTDSSVRRSFAADLNSLDLNAAAAAVLLGQSVDPPELAAEAIPHRFCPDADAWWERLPVEKYPSSASFLTDTGGSAGD
jgi:hypothetical protein